MGDIPDKSGEVRAMYTDNFIRHYKALFRPLSRALRSVGISPNMMTFMSFILACITGALLALDYLWTGLVFGLAMGFADTVDGQLAKEFGQTSKFGAVLDSSIDRYNEFMVFLGVGIRYYLHGRPWWAVGSAVAFFGSIMVSYIKSRAETEGFECKVGRLQRPERLTIFGIGVLFRGVGIDVMTVILAVGTQFTAAYRLYHVYRQSLRAVNARPDGMNT